MEISTPLGKLSVLPIELRDEIYTYIFPKYKITWCMFTSMKTDRTMMRPVASRFGGKQYHMPKSPDSPKFSIFILLLSKMIHEEAIKIFYSQGIFRFIPPHHWHEWINCFPNASITNRIMNIDLSYDMALNNLMTRNVTSYPIQFKDNKYPSPGSPDPATLFTGNDIKRNSALICFNIAKEEDYPIDIIIEPIFDTLAQLTGFRTVTLEVKIAITTSDDEEAEVAGLISFFNKSQALLEPSLGSAMTSELERTTDMFVALQAVFHPLNHVSKSGASARATETVDAV